MNQSLILFGLATTPLELLSFVLSIVTVWLNIRQNHWAWLFAILSSAMYGAVFFESKLYGDMGLQLVFISVSVWGWYQWLHGDDRHERLPVTALTWRGRGVAALAWLLAFAVLAWFLRSFTDTDVPVSDGFLTAGSLVGQLLLSRKRLENWHVWIIVDVLYVALYVHKGLMLTALLYGLFVFMAIAGLQAWRRSMEGDAVGSAAMVLK
ncbi:nicotinamide riboside transporter PnuC [Pseudoduganella buxea]|uniref:Nicotinamide riboside transporter PnuC n=1 Tax=Pseudoduganella buxea TaxID=1949069 RepID=A0A6I3T3W5_9BURK|nr:nicotinamide riboside transporter PnuC [Pseudoduganella buxea]MTV54247.1 nicotinamide riboside transporter PnuC [Pseudoduganella buxea]GGB82841.1 membrane protein [Pseudoduganella buxea]